MGDKPKISVPAALAISQEHIDDLKAGRQLDALVCSHVLRWDIRANKDDMRYGGDLKLEPTGDQLDFPNVSETLPGAHLVIEALAKQGHKVTIQFTGKRWRAWILSDVTTKPDADASTMPLAVARAALKAIIGHEVVELPASRRRVWKAWMREEIAKIRDNPPSTVIRTKKAGHVRHQVEKLKKVQADHRDRLQAVKGAR